MTKLKKTHFLFLKADATANSTLRNLSGETYISLGLCLSVKRDEGDLRYTAGCTDLIYSSIIQLTLQE